MVASFVSEEAVLVALKSDSPSRIERWVLRGCALGGGGGGCSSICGNEPGYVDLGCAELADQSMMVSLEASDGPGDAIWNETVLRLLRLTTEELRDRLRRGSATMSVHTSSDSTFSGSRGISFASRLADTLFELARTNVSLRILFCIYGANRANPALRTFASTLSDSESWLGVRGLACLADWARRSASFPSLRGVGLAGTVGGVFRLLMVEPESVELPRVVSEVPLVIVQLSS